MPTYQDLHITTPRIPRTAITNMPFRVQVSVGRVSGWEAWAKAERDLPPERLGGEFGGPDDWLVLDVDGHVICDGRGMPAPVVGARGEAPQPETG